MTDAAFREGVQVIVGELRHLRESVDSVLEALTTAPADEVAPDPMPCQHQDEHIVRFGITNGQEDWLCRECGFRSVHEGAPV